ncbi:MAG: HAMP domain-containing histidine kinase [Deltaproteobacteria bacterium]|nr:HAMP domain-containing histidine kinase [Deltaproteobacteria bacterium]
MGSPASTSPRALPIPRQEDLPWEHLYERIGWLIRLRTIAVAVALPLLAAAGFAGVLTAVPELLALAAGLGLFNVHCWHRWRSAISDPARPPDTRQLEESIFRQLLVDLVVLTLLIYFGGSVQNPFAYFYAFHMAIGAMLLPRRSAFVLGAVAASCYGAIVLGELVGVLPHHLVRVGAVGTPWRMPSFVLWRFVAVTVTNFGTLYFVSSVADRYRRAEALRHEHDRVALSRERLVRIGEVAAGVAHAVRNPLHGLLNGVEILAARVGDGTTAETLALMKEALQRIDQVTRRLLVLTRDAPLAVAPVDLDALVQDAIALASPRARGSTARVDFVAGGSGTVEVDALRVSEAIVNVIDNALDACKAGGTIIVRTSRGSDADAAIEVADTGPGIPLEDLERVFDPFFTTKAVGEGSGLGLAIARRTVEEHGGRVTIDSAPGTGTRVHLSIPRRAAQGGS